MDPKLRAEEVKLRDSTKCHSAESLEIGAKCETQPGYASQTCIRVSACTRSRRVGVAVCVR